MAIESIAATLSSMRQQVTVRVPASTSNLGPGFDCLGVALRIYNSITDHVARKIAQRQEKIVAQAADLFFKRTKRSRFAFSCSAVEKIPALSRARQQRHDSAWRFAWIERTCAAGRSIDCRSFVCAQSWKAIRTTPRRRRLADSPSRAAKMFSASTFRRLNLSS